MVKEPPIISVVMPLYNKEREVERALHSALAQTVREFELIVVNDGSTDQSVAIAHAINDSRMRIIDQKNAGVSVARNLGIKEARTDIIAFLDADDEWMPDFLETVLRLRTRYPSCSVFATGYLICRENGIRSKAIIRGLPGNFEEGMLVDYFVVAAQSDPPLWTSAVAVTKEAIDSVGGFPEGVNAGEDLLTWAKLAARYPIAYSVSPKACFWEPTGVSDRPGRIPQQPDEVGAGLVHIMQNSLSVNTNGIRKYLSLWHRMRGVIYILQGQHRNALSELKKALYYTPSIKLYLLCALAMMPTFFVTGVLTTVRNLRMAFTRSL
jgi:glycosyltransferase involved in cell wall biosynthesis